ncbi:MAG: DNA polymerase domain-containing protein [Candidatus Micrarchaeota archaeon]
MLVNIVHAGERMHLIYPRRMAKGESDEDGTERVESAVEYTPSFYLLSPEPDYALDVMEKHPLVSRCVIEEKYPNIHASERTRVLRVFVSSREFRKVVSDVSRLGETAEVTIPHHYRFALEKGLTFFEPEGPLTTALMKKGEKVPEADVVFTHGGDMFLRSYPGVLVSKLGCFLRHAVHIDLRFSELYDIYGDDGGSTRLARVMVLSRLTGVKPDIVCRVTPGKLNTFLHMRAAKARGYLIPDKKNEMEKPKTLEMLRRMDRGGTIFYPKPGVYSNVGKCDFSSMYPHVIVRHNISPETMHCSCGNDDVLPVCGWRVCRKRGIIPDGIEAVLLRRLELKHRLRAEGFNADLDARQKALKGLLVVCFGYLGFNNFVFSNVECKECVMLMGRVILERTKAIAEEEGLDVLYGVVDSVFVSSPPNNQEKNFERFATRVSNETGIELVLDCVFLKIKFLPSYDGSGAANRYFGITVDGKIEARGIALRHSDAPEFLKKYQQEAIPAFFSGNFASFREVYARHKELLLSKKIPLDDLSIHKRMRQREYKTEQAHVLAYNEKPDGRKSVDFVHTVYGPRRTELARLEEIDAQEYLRLLERARWEIASNIS